jgi:hypothetical protein
MGPEKQKTVTPRATVKKLKRQTLRLLNVEF